MTDRELLELAAKAAELKIDKSKNNGGGLWNDGFDSGGNVVIDWHNNKIWNPLKNDGDALRLAVKLQLEIYIDHRGVAVRTHCGLKVLEKKCDATATRLAIVRAAAEIGKGMA